MADYGLEFSGFDDLVRQFEQLGGDADEIAVKAINAATPAAVEAFRANVPRGTQFNPRGHAWEHVKAGGMKKSRHGTRYRLVTFDDDRTYLFMVDSGTSKMPAHPWRDKARRDAESAAQPIMAQTLTDEINRVIGGG